MRVAWVLRYLCRERIGAFVRRTAVMAGLLAACAEPSLHLQSQPGEGVAGSEVVVSLGRAGEALSVDWVGPQGQVVTDDEAAWRGEREVVTHLPAAAVPGRWDLRVALDDDVATLSRAFTVRDAEAASVCARAWQTNTSVSLTASEVRIQRFSAGEVVEVETIDIGAVAQIELDADVSTDCAVIWLRLVDGRRLPFDHAVGRPLRARAEQLAEQLARPSVTLEELADIPLVEAD